MTQSRQYSAIVMGASAGALEALSAILPFLPGDFSLPIMLVVHMPADKNSALAQLLQSKCAMKVQEAEDKETIQPGTIYIAPPDYHLLVEPDRRLSLSSDELVMYSRPSIDVLFETAADAYMEKLIGVVLSGANSDGAKGLKTICENGGSGLVQKPETAQSSVMPAAALMSCEKAQALTLNEIKDFLIKAANA